MSKRLLSLLTICIVVLGTIAASNPPLAHATTSTGQYFDHIVFIIDENQAECAILYNIVQGCQQTSPPAKYMDSLYQNYSGATHYTSLKGTAMSGTCPAGVSSTIGNSLPNYIALTSGQAPCTMPCSAGNSCQSPAADCSPNSTTCNMGSTTNIVDRLENAGLTWAAYAEDYPVTSGCYTSGDTGHFAGRHFPFNYYTDITGNSARCSKLFRANSGNNGLPDDTFVNGLNVSAPNFIWLTPNLCDDMHDSCSSPYNSNQIAQGNITLSTLVPQILNSPLFLHTRAALFITFDEGGGSCPNAPSADDCVYTVISGPLARKSDHSSTVYMPGHYSWLSTIENNWGLSCLVSVNTHNDCSASPMSEFFIPSFVMSTSPSSVSIFCNVFGCDPGHTVNSTLTITGENRFSGNVTLSYIAPSNRVSGVYLTGQSSATVPPGTPALVTVTAHGSGTTSGTFVWTINGSVSAFSINTTVTITYTWCAHCVLPH